MSRKNTPTDVKATGEDQESSRTDKKSDLIMQAKIELHDGKGKDYINNDLTGDLNFNINLTDRSDRRTTEKDYKVMVKTSVKKAPQDAGA